MTSTVTLKDNFGVKFHAYDQAGQQIWTNPHVNQTPFIPSTDTKFVESCREVAKLVNPAEGSVFLLTSIVHNVLGFTDFTTWKNLPRVCKSFYIAIKSNLIFAAQFRIHFSNVSPLTKSPFSTEEQFKIYFKTMNNAKKPYKAQYQKINEILSLDKEIAYADSAYSHFSNPTIDMKVRFLANLSDVDADRKLEAIDASNEFSEEANGIKYGLKLYRLMREKDRLGSNDHGGEMAISLQKQQLLCLNAIKTWVREAFNDQNNFNETIQAAIDAKNNPVKSVENAVPRSTPSPRIVVVVDPVRTDDLDLD